MIPCRSFLTTLAIATLGGLFTACSSTTTGSNLGSSPGPEGTSPATLAVTIPADRPQVVVTASVLCDLTRQLAQESVEVTCLIQPGQDPHIYEPTPSDRKAIETAQLVLYGGYDLEPSLVRLVEASPAPKLAVFEQAIPQPLFAEPHDHDHDAEKASGDHDHDKSGDKAPDPHVWHDAKNGIKLVETIAQQLTKLNPAAASQYQTQAQTLTQQFTQLDQWIRTQVATIPANTRKLITTHDALGYYAQAYGFEVAGALEGLSTDEKTTPEQLTNLVKLIQSAQVPAVFAEATTNRSTLETVAREANVAIAPTPLFIDGPGDSNSLAPTYQRMLAVNTCTVVNALGGKCSEADLPK